MCVSECVCLSAYVIDMYCACICVGTTACKWSCVCMQGSVMPVQVDVPPLTASGHASSHTIIYHRSRPHA